MALGSTRNGTDKRDISITRKSKFLATFRSGLRRIGFGEILPISICAGVSCLALRTVLVVNLLWIFLMSVVALHSFNGSLQAHCVVDTNGTDYKSEEYPEENPYEEILHYDGDLSGYCGNSIGSKGCDSPMEICVFGNLTNPDYGFTNFDTVGWSYLTTTRLAVQDYWDDLYIKILLTEGYWRSWFFVVTICTCHCVFGLFIAVIMKKYNAVYKTTPKKILKDEVHNHGDTSGNGVNSHEPHSQQCCKVACSPCCSSFTRYVSCVIFNPIVQIGIVLLLLCNVYFLASNQHNMDLSEYLAINNFNKVYTVTTFLEASLKIIALGPKMYFTVGWNNFEFLLVVMNLVDFVLDGIMGLSIIRSLKLLRIIRLGRFWPTYSLARANFSKSSSIRTQFVLVFGLIVLFVAWIGVISLGPGYEDSISRFPNDEELRWHFMDLMHSFMAVFRMLCGSWAETLYSCLDVNGAMCFPYYFFVVFLGKYLMVNICIAFMLGAMQPNFKEPRNDDYILMLSKGADQIISVYNKTLGLLLKPNDSRKSATLGRNGEVTLNMDETLPVSENDVSTTVIVSANNGRMDADLDPPPDCCSPNSCQVCCPSRNPPKFWTSLRKFSLRVVGSHVFEVIVLGVVIIGCIPLAHRNVEFQDDTGWRKTTLKVIEKIVPSLFLLEMCLKMFAFGWSHFFRIGWRSAEFTIVMVVFMNMILMNETGFDFKVLQSIQVFRLFRILKYFVQCESFRVILNTCLGCIPHLVNAVLVFSVSWSVFVVLGVHLFAGRFYRCVDEEETRLNSTYIPDKRTCGENNLTWVNPYFNFDNFYESSTCLLHVATLNGWEEIMNPAVDSNYIDEQPSNEANIELYIYFVLFVVCVVLPMFVVLLSVLMDSFNRHIIDKAHNSAESQGDSMYKRALNYILNKSLNVVGKPVTGFRLFFRKMTSSGIFSCAVAIYIVGAVMVMCAKRIYSSNNYDLFLKWSYSVLVVELTFEVVFRILACGSPLEFIRSYCNIMDVIALVLSTADLCSEGYVSSYLCPPLLLRILRLAEIFWKQSWSRRFLGIRRIRLTLSRSFHHVLSIYLLVATIIVIYSIIGVAVFGKVETRAEEQQFFNFKYLSNALALMFQLSTTAGFDENVDWLRQERDCHPSDESTDGSCGDSFYTSAFLNTFIVINYITLTTVLVVIIKHYQDSCDDIRLGISPEDSDEFYQLCSHYEVGEGFIPYKTLSTLLNSLSSPLRVAKPNSCEIALMDITIYSDHLVHHRDVLGRLIHHKIIQRGLEIHEECFNGQLGPEDCGTISSSLWRAHEVKCVKLIETVWGNFKEKKSPAT